MGKDWDPDVTSECLNASWRFSTCSFLIWFRSDTSRPMANENCVSYFPFLVVSHELCIYIYIYIYNEMHMHTTISHTFQYPYMTRSFCPKISSLLNHSQHCAVHASYIHLFGFPFLSNLVNGALPIWCSTEHNGFLRGGQFNWQSFWRIGAHQPCHRGSPLNASKWWWQFKLKIALLSISAWTCGIASYMTSVGDVLHHAVVMWLCLKVDHGLNCQ